MLMSGGTPAGGSLEGLLKLVADPKGAGELIAQLAKAQADAKEAQAEAKEERRQLDADLTQLAADKAQFADRIQHEQDALNAQRAEFEEYEAETRTALAGEQVLLSEQTVASQREASDATQDNQRRADQLEQGEKDLARRAAAVTARERDVRSAAQRLAADQEALSADRVELEEQRRVIEARRQRLLAATQEL